MTEMRDKLRLLWGRRSIRRYTDESVSVEMLDEILHAAMAAPSASNRKPWEFVVITEPAILDRLRRHLVLGRYGAPAAICVCGNMRRALPAPARQFWVQDCAAATQNILLAAHALDLGAVWIGVRPIKPFEWGVRRVLGLPRHIRPLGLVWIGHPDQDKAPRSQYDERRVHWQTMRPVPEDHDIADKDDMGTDNVV